MASSSATTASLPTRRRSRQSEHSCLSCRGMHRCTTYITLLSVSLYYSPGVADAFSLVQNAAATSSTSQQQQQPSSSSSSSSSSPDDAPDQAVGGEGTKTTTSNSLHRHTPFSAKAAAAASTSSSSSSNSSNGPFPVPGPFTATNSHNHHNIRNSHGNRPKYQPRTTSSLVASGVHGQHDSSASSTSSSFTDDFLLRMDNVMAEQWDVSKDGSSSAMEPHQYHHCEGPSGSGVTSSSSSSSSSPSPCSSDEIVLVKTDLQESQLYERRAFLHGMLSNTATAAAVVAPSVTTTTTTTTATAGFTSSLVSLPWLSSLDPAYAYEQSYPLELQMTPVGEVENASNSLTKLNEERLSSKKAKVKATQMELRNDPLGLLVVPSSIHDLEVTIAGAITWGLALWFASGSRSSPIVTPLANVLYGSGGNTIDVEDSDDDDDDDKKNRNNNDRNKNNNKSDTNQWLTDRNDGYFGELPPSFMAIVSLVFVIFGIVLDRAVYFLADGDADVSLQLGGVSVIGGAVWEVGRLAAKEKAPTREEYERDVQLYREFQEFADKRIIVGGRRGNDGGGGGGGDGSSRGRSPSSSSCSCHRSDVISAFRRYNPKYRTADNEQFPLSDIEIERILRKWNREFGSGSEMSPAGFFSGICVDGVADAFAPR